MTDVVLGWVLPEPNRERSVDPLGTGAFAERIADLLVPGFSGGTTRARYMSLLCAAVRKAQHAASPLKVIHRLEADHAVREAQLHPEDGARACPNIVGRQRAAAELKRLDGAKPQRPERLYKSTAFSQYSSLLRSLGFVVGRSGTKLSTEGERLAAAYPLHGSSERRCLNAITKREQSQLYGPLGLDWRTTLSDGSAPGRRRATLEYLDWLGERFPGRGLLQRHARLSARPSPVALLLHRAYAWETVSLGLLAGMAVLIERNRLATAASQLAAALDRKPRAPDLGEDLDREWAAEHAVALLREALRVRAALPASCDSHVDIARTLVIDRHPIEFLRKLVERHRLAKGGEAWFRLKDDRVEVIAPGKNLAFRLVARSYRLDAYGQFLRDLKKL